MSGPPDGAAARDGYLKPRSRWWYVYSVLFGGGILYYFALRYDDVHKARRCLWLGVISLAVYPGLILVLAAVSAVAGPDGPPLAGT